MGSPLPIQCPFLPRLSKKDAITMIELGLKDLFNGKRRHAVLHSPPNPAQKTEKKCKIYIFLFVYNPKIG